MIHPKAIKEFLKQPRDSHVWMKKLKSIELDQALDDIGFEQDHSQPELDKHQKVCILLGIGYKTFAFWLDMGLGKTRVSLEIIRYLILRGELKSALVLVFSENAIISWENEIKRWKIDLPIISLLNSSSQSKWDELSEFEGGIILATYAGFTRMVSVRGKTKKGKGVLKLKYSLVKKLVKMTGISCVVNDESTLLGNIHSLQYRINNQLAKYAPWRFELAGRPFGRDPTMLWSQLYLLDRGETLGDTLGLFRAGFFDEKPNRWGGNDYEFKDELRPKLNKILRHRSIQYRYPKLPKMRPILEEVKLPEEATAYYKRFVKQLKKSHAGYDERKNIFIRMRQVSSGFVGIKNDETGEKAEVRFALNPKLDRLIELVQQIPPDRKFIIFHEFKFSGRMIIKALTDAGVNHGWIRGGVKNAREMQDRLDHDKKTRGLLVNHKLGAYSLNLQSANYLFFYESPVPVIDREQAERRVRRKGQKRTIFQYDLVCRGTSDPRILQFHSQGGDLFKAVMKDPTIL